LVKVDPRQLRVAEAVRLLNSTPLGDVVQPQWQGQRTKMVYIFPTNEKLWQQ
jgi:hypothetical protein